MIYYQKGTYIKDKRTQWHPGFVAAMGLAFIQDKDGLTFLKEYNLNTKPLEIDLLVIQKCPGIAISNEIGGIFRGHNIMEYKSPGDRLDIEGMHEQELASSVLTVMAQANRQIIQNQKGDDGMFEALMELFEPEITLMVEEARKETWKEARKECKKEEIQNTVSILRDFGMWMAT